MWQNGNTTREGITADLESMQKVGLGTAQIFNATEWIPPGSASFMGPEWRDLTSFAFQEAHRLGLTFSIFNCGGWSQSGGPWVDKDEAMHMITFSEAKATGPGKAVIDLPQPLTRLDDYSDIAVLAFPTPPLDVTPLSDQVTAATANGNPINPKALFDHDPATYVTLPKAGKPCLEFEFRTPVTARGLSITLLPGDFPLTAEVQASADGQKYESIGSSTLNRAETVSLSYTERTDIRLKPVAAKFLRIVFPSSKGDFRIGEVDFTAGERITNLASKGGWLRQEGYAGSEPLAYSVTPGAAIEQSRIVNLTSNLRADGKLEWDVPPGNWTILRFGHTPTGSQNRAAPKGGTGLECDKFSQRAMDDFFNNGMMKALVDLAGPLAGTTFATGHIDSYEVGCQNWTPAMLEEFKKRRGYDPLPYFPVLSGRIVGTGLISERFLWDWCRTLAQLMDENYYGRFTQLCHQTHLTSSTEPYGMGNFDHMGAGGSCDIPQTEFWPWGTNDNRWTVLNSSIAHTYGSKVLQAESFTAAPERSKWLGHPYRLKRMTDWQFSMGVNRILLSEWAMQPWKGNIAPGMTLGQWGTQFGRTVTWWDMSDSWISYLTRSQYLLQSGLPVADILVYGGENSPSRVVYPAEVSPKLPEPGFYDNCDSNILLHRLSVKNGRLQLPDGVSYRYLLLQPSLTMRPEVLRKIRYLVSQGAVVIGSRPTYSPSLTNFPACDEEVKSVAADLWADCDGTNVKERAYGKGKIISGMSLEQIFAEDNLKPDVTWSPDQSTVKLDMCHRRDGAADIYFLANTADTPVSGACTFRVAGKQPEFWHSDDGRIEKCGLYKTVNGCTQIPIHFDPTGSVFVVFRGTPKAPPLSSFALVSPPDVSADGIPTPEVTLDRNTGITLAKVGKAGTYHYASASGKSGEINTGPLPKPLDITGPWELTFQPGRGAPDHITIPKLISWPDHPDFGVKYFSGMATYHISFNVPVGNLEKDIRWVLDLGRVEVMARVVMNGTFTPTLWKPPFLCDVTDYLKPGENQLEVTVVNLWPNRLIGDEQLPEDCDYASFGVIKSWPAWLLNNTPRSSGRVAFATWKHWHKDDPLLPSGLLGPVRIFPLKQLQIWQSTEEK
jgi:hypothetical protein